MLNTCRMGLFTFTSKLINLTPAFIQSYPKSQIAVATYLQKVLDDVSNNNRNMVSETEGACFCVSANFEGAGALL